ncbi:MAG: hypothetical protein HYV07_07125 [Deltaproteobacteria bacterium]|nr:hypothetical protein [Deltaproteobacteria bacterium]
MFRAISTAILFAGSLALSSCAPEPAPQPPAVPTPPPPGETRIAVVVIVPPTFEKHDDPRVDVAGLVTALLETGLADVTAVVPVVEGAHTAGTFRSPRARPDLRVEPKIELVRDTLELTILSCEPAGSCTVLKRSVPKQTPWTATQPILSTIAETLSLPVPDEVEAAWGRPLSKDAYAVTIAGRSAAVVYGMKAPPSGEARGDRRKDPVARAVFIDPKNALAHWLAGRRFLEEGDPRAARISFQAACGAEPRRISYCAAEAMMLTEIKSGDVAWSVWSKIPGKELRFALPRARAAFMAGRFDDALDILDGLPEDLKSASATLELRVRIADAQGATDSYDELLVRWTAAAPEDPEPVRRRLRLRLAEGKLPEALALTTDLAARNSEAEAKRFEVALSLAMQDYARAALAAEALGDAEIAGRIRARGALEADPTIVPPELTTAEDLDAVMVRAEVALGNGQPDEALALAESVLVKTPWVPEALEIQARAQAAIGDREAFARSIEKLRLADPERARSLDGIVLAPPRPKPPRPAEIDGGGLPDSGDRPDAG